MEKTEIKNGSEIYGTVRELLRLFGADSVQTVEFTDSSHGDSDIRHNYLIDRKYVLRINSAPVMTDRRLEELNRLIERYREFGMHAPKFLKAKDGRFIVERDGNICYLSEYLDETVADDVKDGCLEELRTQSRIFIARFAEKYRNVDLTDTVSMYSIFDLSPYDKLDGLEIDDKQDNFNHLTADLQKAGEYALAERLVQENERIRRELRSFYKELPRCVFQGDENFSNLCVDENRRISGLFDFNMSGTEVIANYLANAALNFFYTDEIMQSRSKTGQRKPHHTAFSVSEKEHSEKEYCHSKQSSRNKSVTNGLCPFICGYKRSFCKAQLLYRACPVIKPCVTDYYLRSIRLCGEI